MKSCPCDECEMNIEGFCAGDIYYDGFNPNDCDCKNNSELIDVIEGEDT